MSTLTIADVERIAALAMLELTAEEKQLFTRQLADILAYAEQVQAVDTSGVAATAHVLADLPPEGGSHKTGGSHETSGRHTTGQGVERADEPQPSLPVDEALANAPDGDADAGLFRVPRVIGG